MQRGVIGGAKGRANGHVRLGQSRFGEYGIGNDANVCYDAAKLHRIVAVMPQIVEQPLGAEGLLAEGLVFLAALQRGLAVKRVPRGASQAVRILARALSQISSQL